jgi:hypothetical protein
VLKRALLPWRQGSSLSKAHTVDVAAAGRKHLIDFKMNLSMTWWSCA